MNEIMKTKDDKNNLLIKLAIEKDLPIDKLQRLIDMRNDEEKRQAKKEFDKHFVEMQKEFDPIDKTKNGYDFKYAPLSMMIQKFGPIISKHGFSYKWKEQTLENGGKKITIIINGWGYSDDNTSFDIPLIQGTKRQNTIQVAGAMSTYGRRYTFKAGFGIVEIGEDNDACFNYEDGIFYASDIQRIRDCGELGKLQILFKELWHKYGTDQIGQKIISVEKDKKKKELQNK